MICTSCTHRLNLLSSSQSPILRTLSTTTILRAADPTPATSTSAAQPFSTPFTPSPSKTPGFPSKGASASAASPLAKSQAPLRSLPASSVPAGTPLRGLGFTKGQEPPVAREDKEYPAWLWGLLEKGPKGGEGEGEVGDAFAKSKKQRRLASKAARALATGGYATQHIVKVPLEQQSIDLPGGTGVEEGRDAQAAREELNGAMRKARRRGIKENNFLRAMR